MPDLTHTFYNKYISRPLIAVLLKTNITANNITVFNFIFSAVFGCLFFASRHYIAGLGVMFISVFLDYIDGDLARNKKQETPFGVWFENFGDMALQNLIMGALWYSIKPPVGFVISYFVTNILLHILSLTYNDMFGFDSYKGNILFRQFMDEKKTIGNRIIKNIIDPTASIFGIFLFTVRYLIIVGMLFNILPSVLFIILNLVVFRMFIMFCIFAIYLGGSRDWQVLKALEKLWEHMTL